MMLFTATLAAVLVVSSAYIDPLHLCDALGNLDCRLNYIQGEKDEVLCGTNGQTYNNFCYYARDRCNDKNLNIAALGACPSGGVVTATAAVATAQPVTTMGMTMTTTPGPTTPDPIMAAFCQNKNSIQCGTDLSPICGSDKQFYLNQCEYSKAYCDNRSLTSKDISFCTGGK